MPSKHKHIIIVCTCNITIENYKCMPVLAPYVSEGFQPNSPFPHFFLLNLTFDCPFRKFIL